ncbi:hypothetical protein KTT_45610 [Tengunoibacter tsumagoiensis]|uniref:Uncharacterized protein n=1 Tax=Tengunoibacter tsumagoiensis TaxID=2014871 RepID=A0A402A6E7_9CHLR|nr:hypothetical protein KTT_45610 [Tengunoibacter tsumagoiensis]
MMCSENIFSSHLFSLPPGNRSIISANREHTQSYLNQFGAGPIGKTYNDKRKKDQ